MNRQEAAASLEVSPNTLKNWADQIYCKLPKTFTQADLTLLQSYRALAAQQPPLEIDTIILMILPLINSSTLIKTQDFPYVEVDQSSSRDLDRPLLPSSGAGGSDNNLAHLLDSFVTDSVQSITCGMGAEAADAFVGALNSDQFRVAFRNRIIELSRSIAPSGSVPIVENTTDYQTLDIAATSGALATVDNYQDSAEPKDQTTESE